MWMRSFMLVLLAAAVAACAEPSRSPAADPMASIIGIATYRERMALPADARFEATLEDVSRADAPSQVVARAEVQPVAQPPISFKISYKASELIPGHRYSIRGKITRAGQLLFTTTQHYEVPPPGGTVALELVRAGNSFGTAASAELENTYWKLMSLGEVKVLADAQREPHFILHPAEHRLSGSAGCNRITGGYSLSGDRLTFTGVARTMMACPEGMQYEQAFHETLINSKQWMIEGERLMLSDETGTVLATFESRYMH